MKKIIITLALVSFFSFCSSELEVEAVFRGDVPVKFSVTSIEFTEGNTKSMSVSLLKPPSSDVTINLAVNDLTQIEIEPSTVFFTPQNYSTAQTILVRAVNDCTADGTKNVNISVTSIESADSEFSGIQNLEIPVTVNDSPDSNPNIIFYAPSEIITSELGTTSFFKAKLSCAPTADVVVPLEISDTAEVSIDKASLLFQVDDPATTLVDESNYSEFQTVTLTGLSDCALDSDKSFTIRTRNVTSTDTRFNRYHDTNTMAEGETRKYATISGKNINVAVENDLIFQVPIGGMEITLDYNSPETDPETPELFYHPDRFISVYASLSCPVTSQVNFSFVSKAKNLGTEIYEDVGDYIKAANTPSGNNFISFYPENWSQPQNILLMIDDSVAPDGFFDFMTYEYYVSIFESTADNLNPQPITDSVYSEKKAKIYITIK